MPAVKVPQNSTVGIKVQSGINASGNPLYKTIHFNSVKSAAADQDVYDVATSLADLQ